MTIIVFAILFATVALGLLAICAQASSVQPLKEMAARVAPVAVGLTVLVVLIISVKNWYLEWYWERKSHSPSYLIRGLGMGLLNYESAHKRFPPPAMNDHSWRIRIVPYLISSAHYSEYDFELAWDSSKNMLLDRRPLRIGKGPTPDEEYICGMPFEFGSKLDFPQQTRFLMVVGDDFFGFDGGGRRANEIIDGMENTIAIVETSRCDIHWLHPLDINGFEMSFRVNDGPNSIGTKDGGKPVVCFCDGQVFQLDPKIPEDALKALLTINGKEGIDRNTCIANGWLLPTEK